jgi:hypothetical protein
VARGKLCNRKAKQSTEDPCRLSARLGGRRSNTLRKRMRTAMSVHHRRPHPRYWCWGHLPQAGTRARIGPQRGHSSAPTALERHVRPRRDTGMCTRGVLQRRHVVPGTPRGSGSMSTMKRRFQLPLTVRTRRLEVCAHTLHTRVSGCVGHHVVIEKGSWRPHTGRRTCRK